VRAGAKSVEGRFGFPTGVIDGDVHTDGAEFTIYWFDGKTRKSLFSLLLKPQEVPADRTLQSYKLDLPTPPPGAVARLVFVTSPLANMAKDWTCWSKPEFK
jgi:hypothetical protein